MPHNEHKHFPITRIWCQSAYILQYGNKQLKAKREESFTVRWPKATAWTLPSTGAVEAANLTQLTFFSVVIISIKNNVACYSVRRRDRTSTRTLQFAINTTQLTHTLKNEMSCKGTHHDRRLYREKMEWHPFPINNMQLMPSNLQSVNISRRADKISRKNDGCQVRRPKPRYVKYSTITCDQYLRALMLRV